MSEPLDDLANAASTASNRNAPSWARTGSYRTETGPVARPQADAGEAFRWGFFAGFGIWIAWFICSVSFLIFCIATGIARDLVRELFR